MSIDHHYRTAIGALSRRGECSRGSSQCEDECRDQQEEEHALWLVGIPVGEVWGVRRASLAKLQALGVDTVAALRDLDPRPARKALTVVGERIIHELHGCACL